MNFNPARGSEQAGRRPALVVQADFITEAKLNSVVMVAISTGSHGADALHVSVEPSSLFGLTLPAIVKCEQILTVAVDRLETFSGILEPKSLTKANMPFG